MLAGLLSESILVKKHKQESFMTRVYCITLLAIVVPSSFAGAAQNLNDARIALGTHLGTYSNFHKLTDSIGLFPLRNLCP